MQRTTVSVGPALRKVREARGVTLEEAARDTRVRLEFLEAMEQRRLFLGQFLFRLRPMGRIGLFRGELAQRFEIGHGAFEFAQRIQERTNPRNFLDIALGALAIRPKIRRAHPLFERAELGL